MTFGHTGEYKDLPRTSLWFTDNDTIVATFVTRESDFIEFAVSPDGSRLAVLSNESVEIFNLPPCERHGLIHPRPIVIGFLFALALIMSSEACLVHGYTGTPIIHLYLIVACYPTMNIMLPLVLVRISCG